MKTHFYFDTILRLANHLPDEAEKRQQWITQYFKIRRLAKKHHRLAKMDCNGEGVLRGYTYTRGNVEGKDRWKISAYLRDGETTIFTAESDKVEAKISELALSIGLLASFQGDPRGNTVKLETGDGREIPII